MSEERLQRNAAQKALEEKIGHATGGFSSTTGAKLYEQDRGSIHQDKKSQEERMKLMRRRREYA